VAGDAVRRLAVAAALVLLLAAPASGGPDGLRVRWLGVAGFSFDDGETVLLHDPYLSRPGLTSLLFSRYRPDAARLAALVAREGPLPELARASWILIGHGHFDHLGDAPWLAGRSGASVVGSATAVNVARGYGVPEAHARRLDPGQRLEVGAFEVRVVASRHARVALGRVPLDGVVTSPPDGPIHALSFKLGDARSYLLSHRRSGLRVFVTSSADRDLAALEVLRAEGVEVDLLLAAIQGRDADFARDLVRALRPRRVVPHHFDDFLVPLDAPDAGAARDPDDLAAFEAEVRAAAEAEGVTLELRRPALLETLLLEAAAGAAPAPGP
jgi:L-ascorbate metabolism protein UlaG (beta-lactamase superfamily)